MEDFHDTIYKEVDRMMEDSNQPNLDSWDDFAGDWLKAEYMKLPAETVCVNVEGINEDGRNKLILILEYKKKQWKFEANKTNQNFIKSKGLTPKQLIGKKVIFDKIKVRNPTSNSMVDSLIIDGIA